MIGAAPTLAPTLSPTPTPTLETRNPDAIFPHTRRVEAASGTTSPSAKQLPFPGLPKGWFVVALAQEIEPGKVHSLRYFGRDLVAFRGESGRVHVTEAYCPHLGAHLAYGGKIEGDNIRCPFHGWSYDGASGRCMEVPYADRVPPKAKLDALPTLEQDGVVYVFYDPERGEPWPLPPLEHEGWTRGRAIHWPGLRSHPQEISENTVDTAHIGPVHSGHGAHVKSVPQREGEVMRIQINFEASGELVGMPEQINDVHLDVTMRGLGWMYVHTHVPNAGVDACQRIYVTPVDDSTVDIRGIIHVKATDDPTFTEDLERLFFEAYCSDFPKDFPIWENKRYLERPVLAKGDGPIGIYRRWCTQFYPKQPELPQAPSAAAAPATPAIVPVEAVAKRGVLRSLMAKLGFAASTPASTNTAARSSAPTDELDTEWKAPTREAAMAGKPAVTAAANDPAPTSGLHVESAEDYFTTLPQRFVAKAAKGVDAVFQWELTGEGGQTFHAIVRDQTIDVQRGSHDKPTVTLEMGASDYVKVIAGELDGMKAFASGKGKVKGSISMAMKMKSIFPA